MVENYDYHHDEPAYCKQNQLCPKDRACDIKDTDFIVSDYKGVGYCELDGYQCPRESKYPNRDVDKPSKWPKTALKYGANFSDTSFVVQGRFQHFTPDSYTTETQLPVTGECNDDQTEYTMNFKNYKYNLAKNTHGGDF